MSESGKIRGTCLCGAVSLSIDAFAGELHACHCSMCRKWGGGPFLAIDCGKDVRLDGREFVAAFESSAWAQRGFCRRCGTHLYYRLKASDRYMMPIGLFDGNPGVSFVGQLFIDEKPEYYAFANETRSMTGAEVMAKYAPGPD